MRLFTLPLKMMFGLLLMAGISLSAQAQLRKVGYMPSWAGDANSIQYSKLTHINYAFAIPQSNGSIMAVENGGKLQTIVSRAHAAGVKVLIAIGGWSYQGVPLDGVFETLASNAASRDRFINDAMYIVSQYNLDGVDIDWEYPDAGASSNNFNALMTGLSNRLKPAGKLLTAAVIGNGSQGGGVSTTVFSVVDFLNIMAYDANNYDHSTFSYATQCLNYWNGRGLAKNKIVLGVPFYGRPSWSSYATLVNQGANPNADIWNGNGYNGIPTIKQKSQYVKDNSFGGIMIWELSQDLFDSRSLLSAIHDVLGTSTPPPPTPQSPYGGTRWAIPGTIEAENYDLGGQNVAFNDVTPANEGAAYRSDAVDIEPVSGGGFNVGWIQANEWLKYSVNITAAGTYKIDARVAAISAGRAFRIEIDGATIATINVPNTGGWQNWQTVTVNNVTLTAGQKVLRIFANTGDFNVDRVVFSTTASNQAPTVSLTAPANNSTYTAPANITISANASDADGSVTKVDFYNGSTLLNSDASAPYSFNWSNVGAGTYTITARATDNQGATTTSAARTITVNTAGNQPPTVSLTSPANNANFNAPASITISANAADANGTVTKVDFYNGSTLLNSDASAPYSFNWTNVAAGTYTITARATDNQGATTTSAAVTIRVNTVNTGGCSGIAQYTENGGYNPGSKVQNAGKQYECRPWPYSGWCNGAAWAYGPGTGTYWTDAWTLVGSCTGRSAADLSSNETATVNDNLLSNSPNPFSESTNIEVTLAEAGEVSVQVFNKSGQVVGTVVEGNLSAGTHTFNFDTAGLTPDMYILKCNTNHGVITRKIVKNQ